MYLAGYFLAWLPYAPADPQPVWKSDVFVPTFPYATILILRESTPSMAQLQISICADDSDDIWANIVAFWDSDIEQLNDANETFQCQENAEHRDDLTIFNVTDIRKKKILTASDF